MSVRQTVRMTFLVSAAACSSCFVGGTRIATPKGPRRIDDLAVGDEVWAWDTERGVPVARAITAVMRSTTAELFRVAAGELVIDGVTAEHPFWDPSSRTWRKAAELVQGGQVWGWLGAGDAQALALTEVSRRAEEAEIFNLTVEGEHCYFAEGLLVHNKSPATATDTALPELEVTPETVAVCETALLQITPVDADVTSVSIDGPSLIDILTQEPGTGSYLVTIEVEEKSVEAVNDIVVDWADGRQQVLPDALRVQGNDCD